MPLIKHEKCISEKFKYKLLKAQRQSLTAALLISCSENFRKLPVKRFFPGNFLKISEKLRAANFQSYEKA